MYGMLSNNPLHFPGLHKVPSTSCVYSIPSCNPLPHRQAAAKPLIEIRKIRYVFSLPVRFLHIEVRKHKLFLLSRRLAIILPSGPATPEAPQQSSSAKLAPAVKRRLYRLLPFKSRSHRFLAGTLHAAGQNIILAPLSAAIRAGSGNSKS